MQTPKPCCALGAAAIALFAGTTIANASEPYRHYAPQRSWSGFWIGAHVGGSRSSYDARTTKNRVTSCLTSTAGEATASCKFPVGGDDDAIAETTAGNSDLPMAKAAAEGDRPSSRSTSNDAEVANSGSDSFTTNVANVDFIALESAGPNQDGASADSASVILFPKDGSLITGAISKTVAGDVENSGSAISFLDITPGSVRLGGDQSSITFGGHLRYDRQVTSRFLIGVELSASVLPESKKESRPGRYSARFKGEAEKEPGSSLDANVHYQQKISAETDTLASARLRFGFVMDHFMAYVTAGVAVGDFDVNLSERASLVVNADVPQSGQFMRTVETQIDKNRTREERVYGGVIGGGVSWLLHDRFMLGAEALYYNFDERVQIGDRATFELGRVVEVNLKLSTRLY